MRPSRHPILAPKRRDLASLRQGLVATDYLRLVYPVPPPSLNSNWKANGGGAWRRSEKYETWRDRVGYWLNQNCRAYIVGEFFGLIMVGTCSGADVDNVIKPAIDVLVSYGRIDDDRRQRMRGVAVMAVEDNADFVVLIGQPHHRAALAERWARGI